MADYLMHNYKRLPIQFEKGEGVWLWDDQGEKYLDALSGVAVCGLGHAHPKITAAVCEQAARLIHTSNIYGIALQEKLAAALCEVSQMKRAFFCNSGAEANEAAIKIARLHGHNKAISTPAIIVMENSFHGRTLATLSATGNRRVQAGFEPLVQGFIRVPYDDIQAIQNVAENSGDVVAVLVEPVQGEGGVRVPAKDYLLNLRRICDQNGWLLMLDEIQTGMGRTGKWFGFQHTDIRPDVMTLAKGLGNGVPIGACLAAGPASEVMQPGTHGSTFGGNPLACNAALAVINAIADGAYIDNADKLGKRMRQRLQSELSDLPGVVAIRGQGLMIGIELNRPCAELVARALQENRLLINVTADNTIRLLPPLIINNEQADRICADVISLIQTFLAYK